MRRNKYTQSLLSAGWIILSLSVFFDLHSQTAIITDNIINEYQKITSIHSLVSSDNDSVFVEDASAFNKNEVALFIVNQGAEIKTEEGGDIGDMNNTGKYALIFIDTVEYDKNLVIFNSTLPGVTSLKTGESAQLVTVPRYKNMVVASTLSCKAWDAASGTGGVLVFIAGSTLELQADIDVSGKGFKGANPGTEQYEGSCSFEDAGYFNDFFTITAKDSGAMRGEGIAASDFPYPRGKLTAGNSGSGGNGRFSGGGGGSNGGSGGKGGREAKSCSPSGDIGGLGGVSLTGLGFYSNTGLYPNRIFMGGGGGTGTQDFTGGRTATPGGNGGGIVIFSADKVLASGYSIKTNGEAVTAIAGAGAGGGGGGGVIVADVAQYLDPLTVEIKGGNGGIVLSNSDTTGPGGGGGGGVYWFNQSSVTPAPNATPPANVTSIRDFGGPGVVQFSADNFYGATNGSRGSNIPNLILPRRGFLINKIPDDQVICENNVPYVLITPPAGGGNGGPYTYKWLQSEISFDGPWIPAAGVNSEQNYAPPALSDTTFYSRVISDGSLVDTSFAVMIAVHPSIGNNDLITTDTICAQLSAGQLSFPDEIRGGLGNGTYTFMWESSPDNSTWLQASGINNTTIYQTPVLNESIYYRRKVSSGVCVDTSNSFTVQVLPLLTNNNIAEDQIICSGQQPAALSGSNPDGGLAGDRRYLWESSINLSQWFPLASNRDYTPGTLTDTTYYRRIAFSGPGNTCENISDTLKITVLPTIINNTTNHQDTLLCSGLPGLSFTGSQPSGGDGDYKYIWEKRNYTGSTWNVADSVNMLQTFETESLSDSTWFRRTVKSGAADVCVSRSDSFLVSILPLVINNSISAPQIICENTVPNPFTGSVPTGGNGIYLYEWQMSSDGTGNWESTIPVGENITYPPPALSLTTFYRRAVYSGPANTCKSFSDNVKIEVQPSISNNSILSGNLIFTCYNTQPDKIEGSNDLSGGNDISYNFFWEESTDLVNWANASQINAENDYQPQVLFDSIYYRRIVSSGSCLDTTSVIKVGVNPLPVLLSISKLPADNFICDDEKLFLKVTISNGEAPYNLSYSNAIDPGTIIQSIPTDTSSFLVNIIGAEPNNYSFRINELTDNNGCRATTANLDLHETSISVYRAPRPTIAMQGLEEACGNSITLTAQADIGNGVWRSINPVFAFADSLNAVTQVYFSTPGFNTLSTSFYYVESTPGCGERKDSVSVNFYEQPEDAIITTDSTGFSPHIVFLVDNITINALAPTAGSGSWILDSGPGVITSQNNTSANLSNLEVDQQTKVIYNIVNGVCDIKTSFILIERKDVKIYEGFSPNGDDLNDYLYAEGIDRSSDEMQYSLTIFNNAGALVRELTHESPLETTEKSAVWDGISQNGKLSADGTYYYVMKINYKGAGFVYKGFFVLKKE